MYMNLGSLTVKLRLQRAEFLLHGLAAAGYAFLCVLRPDMVHQTSEVLQEAGDAVAGASERAMVVQYATMRCTGRDVHYVLRHRAVTGVLPNARRVKLTRW